ncbi:MAG: HNH endonuclease [Acidobacteriota bacterium]
MRVSSKIKQLNEIKMTGQRETIKQIPLTRGRVAIVDAEDYSWLSQYKWFYSSKGYASTKINYKHIYMHRMILDAPKGLEVDHINLDTLDNRRQNIRLATKSQNQANCPKHNGTQSTYKGVHIANNKHKKAWQAQTTFQGRKYSFGTFENECHAAMVYDIYAKDMFGEFANLNFPNAIHGGKL